MKPLNESDQIPESSAFTNAVIVKVRKYETKRKNRRMLIETTVIIFLSYLLLTNEQHLINKLHHHHHLGFNEITEELMQLNHRKKTTQTFGFDTGKIINANWTDYT